MKKLIKISCVIIPAILLAAGAGIFTYYQYKKVSYGTNIRGEVTAEVVISRNSAGIPLIQAKTPEDLYFSMGYVHGQDRLDVMEYYRTMANGQPSALYGKPGDPMDRIVRTFGIPLKARLLLEKVQKPYRDYLDAYARGVNQARKQAKPWRESRRNWNAVDILSIALLWDICHAYLNNMENIFQFPDTVSRSLLRSIFPENYLYFYNREDEKSIQLIRNIRDIIGRNVALSTTGYSLFVGPRSTKGAQAVSAFSYSSGTGIYPVLYPLEIHLGGIKIDGVTMTGLPFIFSGDNRKMKFFSFSLNTDTQDFVLEKIRIIDGAPHVLGTGGWKKFGTVRVPFYDTAGNEMNDIVTVTDSGPVLNGIFRDGKNDETVVALKMDWPREDYYQALFDIPFSEDIRKAALLVRNIASLPRVYLFTDETRSLKAFSGKMPQRVPSENVFRPAPVPEGDYRIDLSGFTYENEYQALAGSALLFDAPQIIRGQSLADDAAFQRLGKLLEKKQTDPGAATALILSDTRSWLAEKFVPKFLVLLGNNPITSARLTRIYLHDWDLAMDPELIPPSIFSVILKNFIQETYADELKAADPGGINGMDYIIKNYGLLAEKFYRNVDNSYAVLFDNVETDGVETVGMTFDRAFLNSMRYLNRKKGPVMEDWKWGEIHKGFFKISAKQYTAVTRFFNKIGDQGFPGDIWSLQSGMYDENFVPVSVSSLMGIYHKKDYRIYMNYAASTNPFSRYFYGNFRHSDAYFTDVRTMESDLTMTITP